MTAHKSISGDSTYDTEHQTVDGTYLVSVKNVTEEDFIGAHLEKPNTNIVKNLKTTTDGSIILIPQPSDDPEDPLNWSWAKKHRTMLALGYCSIMTDLSSAWCIPLVPLQAEYWGISLTDAGRNMSGNIFMLGVGGIIAVPLCQRYGRLPVLFWSMFLAFFMTLWCALSQNWIVFLAGRCLSGLASTTPQIIGLSFIHDMFFFHEHARKIGIWIWAVIFSPYIGPFLSSLIAEYTGWRTSIWVLFAMFGLAVILVVSFADETIYDRKFAAEQPTRPESYLRDRFESLVGIRGWKATHRRSAVREFLDLGHLLTRPYFLLVLFFQMLTFMWSIGINVSLPLFVFPPPPAGYGFSSLTIALLYIGPMIASVIGELFGHFFNDWLANSYIKRHHGIYQPETRLWMTWISTAFMVGGLIFIGFVFEELMGFYIIEVAWGIYLFGMITAVVAVNAYALDVFPDTAVQASALLNIFRTTGGFIVNYFQVQWAEKNGAAVSFGTQGAVVVAGWALIVIVQIFGKKWREMWPARHPQRASVEL